MNTLTIALASNNIHKRQEFNEIAKILNLDIVFVTPLDLGIESDPIEDGKTYHENALIKAKALKNLTDLPVLADDTGIEIEALGPHYPGLYSRRYGDTIKDLREFSLSIAGSKASFHCALVYIDNEGIHSFEGYVPGTIVPCEGEHGFGYDPLFKPDGSTKSYASMSVDEKNKCSHRYQAFSKLASYLTK